MSVLEPLKCFNLIVEPIGLGEYVDTGFAI